MAEVENEGQRRWREWGALALVALAAFAIRLWYIRTTIVDDPLRGDALQYFKYAVNLVQHHVFSGAPTNAPQPPPDTYRDPGYPLFLAALGSIYGWGESFYQAVLVSQAALSAATVLFFGMLGRQLLSFRAGLCVAVILALWPHLISLSGYLLSETLTGFFIAAACVALDAAVRKRSTGLGIVAGLCFAGAGLTNAVFVPFAPLFALVAFWRDPAQRRIWAVIFVASVLPVAAWMGRNASIPGAASASSRVAVNFVQGSWPQYHEQYAMMTTDRGAADTMAAIDAEYRLVAASPVDGLQAVGRRLLASPGHYLAWYLHKPLELWGWNIGIGQGDVYVFATRQPLLAVNPVLRATTGVIFLAAPFIMLAAFIGMILALGRCGPGRLTLCAVAALALYATLVYTVLQADARYATPLRGVEVLLAVSAILALLDWWRARRNLLNQ